MIATVLSDSNKLLELLNGNEYRPLFHFRYEGNNFASWLSMWFCPGFRAFTCTRWFGAILPAAWPWKTPSMQSPAHLLRIVVRCSI